MLARMRSSPSSGAPVIAADRSPESFAELADRVRVLLAEDDVEMRRMIVAKLEGAGLEVIELPDGGELLAYLVTCAGFMNLFRAPDVVVSDMRMPGSSGLEVLSAIRKNGWSLPFILITAFGSDEVLEEARALGVAAVLDKPFNLDALVAAIRVAALSKLPPHRC
jgi:CheY-like chemotaxis protein